MIPRGVTRRIRKRLTYQRAIPLLAVLSGVPAIIATVVLVWTGDYASRTQWTVTVFVLGAWTALLVAMRDRLVRPLHAVSNMLEALREGDYSLRTRAPDKDDALGLILHEVNQLAGSFHDQRLDALEASKLLTRVMTVIDVALFAFDDHDRLRLLNRAGEDLLGRTEEVVLGHTAEELGLGECLGGETPRVMDVAVADGLGRWELRRRSFRWEGRPHRLVVLADLSQVLREEERVAWQRLIRVLSHEINNSLTPIKSIASSLSALLDRRDDAGDDEADLKEGLQVIADRSEALGRFMSSYARLARLPHPQKRELSVREWVQRVASLESRMKVEVLESPDVRIEADGDQLDQLLINLLDNAVDASLETGGGVSIRWADVDGHVEVRIDDEGPGLAQTANLFVPFFTTKPKGSGIGLALSRQIVEAHGGRVTLHNHTDGPGCAAEVWLPKRAQEP
ncbi:MAG: PAS domain-containing sensor histidine kinase [Gemmatimonadetes bacterium]|nr:PAS domain-containing sensor histidine kinase [Gemmatimonadota bacterium]